MLVTKTERSSARDLGAVAILTSLLVVGLIPWVGVLRGSEPAYSAELGAAVAAGALFLLVPTLLEMRPRGRSESGDEPPRDPE